MALGDLSPIKAEDMWDRVASDMATNPYKALGMDLQQAVREGREEAVRAFMREAHRVEQMETAGIPVGREMRFRAQAETVRGSIPTLLASLDRAIQAAETSLTGPMMSQEAHLRSTRVDAEPVRRRIEQAARHCSASPGM